MFVDGTFKLPNGESYCLREPGCSVHPLARKILFFYQRSIVAKSSILFCNAVTYFIIQMEDTNVDDYFWMDP